jgi:hypothetical protein
VFSFARVGVVTQKATLVLAVQSAFYFVRAARANMIWVLGREDALL